MATSTALPLEALSIESMASGNLSLTLTKQVSWEQFPTYALRVLDVVDGRVASRADSPAERVWSVTIEGQAYWLSFNDFALGISLDSCDAGASALLPAIRATLERYRQPASPA